MDRVVVHSGPESGGVMPPGSVYGPSAKTRRDPVNEHRWDGLSLGDCAILAAFLKQLGVVPDELHTHIPVGGVVTIPAGDHFAGMRAMVNHLYPRRVDAAVCFGAEWWILECKPSSRMAGLGQLLSYFYWWCRDCPRCDVRRLVLVCEDCDVDEVEAYRAAGVDVAVV